MFCLAIFLSNAVLSNGALIQTSTPTDDWLAQCEDLMKNENLFYNFSMAAAHGIHSITLQDIRAFFDKEAIAKNGVPTVNRNLTATDEEIIVPNAPDIPGDFKTIGMHTFDVALRFMDDPNYIQNDGILERLSHHFHMHETWTEAQTYFRQYLKSGVDSRVCACALNTAGNGMDQELINIFFYFRDFFNKPKPKVPKQNSNKKDQKAYALAASGRCDSYYYFYRYRYIYYCGGGVVAANVGIAAISHWHRNNKQDHQEKKDNPKKKKPGNRKPKQKKQNKSKKQDKRKPKKQNKPKIQNGHKPLPKLNSSKAWVVWRKMLHSSMLEDEDVKKFALFMYCALA